MAREGRFNHIEIHLLHAQSSRMGSAEKKARRAVKNTSTPSASARAGISTSANSAVMVTTVKILRDMVMLP